MTTAQLSMATALAEQHDTTLFGEDISMFDGYGFASFARVYCTVRQVAALIRWQAARFDGTIDGEELNAIAAIGRHKFVVIGEQWYSAVA